MCGNKPTPDPPPRRGAKMIVPSPGWRASARREPERANDGLEQRALSCAVRAHDCNDLSPPDLERYVTDDRNRAVPGLHGDNLQVRPGSPAQVVRQRRPL